MPWRKSVSTGDTTQKNIQSTTSICMRNNSVYTGLALQMKNLLIDGWGMSCEIALIWMALDITDDQSTLVQVMAWCRQATSHYLSQYWPRSVSPHGVTRPQWVKATLMYQGYTVYEYRVNLVRRCQPLSNITVYTYSPWLIEKFAYVIEFIVVTISFQWCF